MSRLVITLFAGLVACGLLGSSMPAQDQPSDAAPPAEKPKGEKGAKGEKSEKGAGKSKQVLAEREAELLAFVKSQHPELAALLEHLKPVQAKEYQAAVHDLDRDVRRLEVLRKKAPKQYDRELSLWVTRSRIRLLAARLSMSEDAAVREELRAQLRQLRELELASLQQEIGPLQQSIEKQQLMLQKLQQRLSDLQVSDDEWLARQMAELPQKPKSVGPVKTVDKSKFTENSKSEPSKTEKTKPEKSKPVDKSKLAENEKSPAIDKSKLKEKMKAEKLKPVDKPKITEKSKSEKSPPVDQSKLKPSGESPEKPESHPEPKQKPE